MHISNYVYSANNSKNILTDGTVNILNVIVMFFHPSDVHPVLFVSMQFCARSRNKDMKRLKMNGTEDRSFELHFWPLEKFSWAFWINLASMDNFWQVGIIIWRQSRRHFGPKTFSLDFFGVKLLANKKLWEEKCYFWHLGCCSWKENEKYWSR